MVSTDPSEGAVEPRGIEDPGLDSRPGQDGPNPAGVKIERAKPVTEDADPHALLRALGEGFGELEADLVAVNHVALEMDRARGGRDRLQPRRIVLLAVFEDSDGVAGTSGAPVVRANV